MRLAFVLQIFRCLAVFLCIPLVSSIPPRWRAYTSSSYYYTDYTIPKPHGKHKFVLTPQYCPDTGRTVCKSVKDYPEEHIYQLLMRTKAMRFNFTTVFMDEREGDVTPNNKLLPEGPPKALHDGYVVYQTAVHYDYHVPSASVPWQYAAAPAVSTINTQTVQRRRRPIMRRQIQGDEKDACSSRVVYIEPLAALNDNSEWKYVINVQNKNGRFKQIIKVEVCTLPGSSCESDISMGYGWINYCKQKYIKKAVLTLDPDGLGTSMQNIFAPSCCVCHLARRGENRRRR